MKKQETLDTLNEMKKRGIISIDGSIDGNGKIVFTDKIVFTEKFKTQLSHFITSISKKMGRTSPSKKDVRQGIILAILDTAPAYKKEIHQMTNVILAMLDTLKTKIGIEITLEPVDMARKGGLYDKLFKGKVCFKNEDEIDGIPIGAVWIDGRKMKTWMTKPDAIQLAKKKNMPFGDV